AIDDRQSGGLAVAQNGEQRAPAAVGAHNAGLDGIAVADLGDILQKYRRSVDDLDRKVVEIGKQARTAVQLDLIILVADLGGAGRHNQILQIERVGNVGGGER